MEDSMLVFDKTMSHTQMPKTLRVKFEELEHSEDNSYVVFIVIKWSMGFKTIECRNEKSTSETWEN